MLIIAINVNMKTHIIKFLTSYYNIYDLNSGLDPRKGDLKEFTLTMFATLLMYLDVFINRYSVSHCLISIIIEQLGKFPSLTLNRLLEWGELILNDFLLKNSLNNDRNHIGHSTSNDNALQQSYHSQVV